MQDYSQQPNHLLIHQKTWRKIKLLYRRCILYNCVSW
uniref:Uncharacterized protein n=1 Tax=Rhizophora mucronata TaxID=61149 RepID=A0A2P2QVE2_RHIMU